MILKLVIFLFPIIFISCMNKNENDNEVKKIYQNLIKDKVFEKFKSISIMPREENSNLFNIYFHLENIDVWVNYNKNNPEKSLFKSIHNTKLDQDIFVKGPKNKIDSIMTTSLSLLKIITDLNLKYVSASLLYQSIAFGINARTSLNFYNKLNTLESVQKSKKDFKVLDNNWYVLYEKW